MKGFQIYSIVISCGIREVLYKVCKTTWKIVLLRVNVSVLQDFILDLSEMYVGMVPPFFFLMILQENLNTAIPLNTMGNLITLPIYEEMGECSVHCIIVMRLWVYCCV